MTCPNCEKWHELREAKMRVVEAARRWRDDLNNALAGAIPSEIYEKSEDCLIGAVDALSRLEKGEK